VNYRPSLRPGPLVGSLFSEATKKHLCRLAGAHGHGCSCATLGRLMSEAKTLTRDLVLLGARCGRGAHRRRVRWEPCLSAAVALALLAGCSRHGKETEATLADAGASVASPAPSPSTALTAASASAGGAVLFGPKLAQEAQGRPTGTPKAEDVLAAISATGVALTSEAQHVASTIGAHFCIGATSPLGLRISACEYDTEAGAAAGRDLSAKAFAKIEHRDITLNKKTSLTILQQPFTPDSQSAHDKAVAAFQKM
jgi:hypothetical protein